MSCVSAKKIDVEKTKLCRLVSSVTAALLLSILISGNACCAFQKTIGEKQLEYGPLLSGRELTDRKPSGMLVNATSPKKKEDLFSSISNSAHSVVITGLQDKLVPLPSRWPEYFGTHYISSPKEAGRTWRTVRSYGGVHVGIPEDETLIADDSPMRVGPFTGKSFRLGLKDFGSRKKRQKINGLTIFEDLVKHQLTAVYLTTQIVKPTLNAFDKDLLYWTLRMIYERFPVSREHVAWQIGNEIVSGHFDPMGLKGKVSRYLNMDGSYHGYDLEWKKKYYVNDYLSPAIEAAERVGRDLFGDPDAPLILLGSMNPYNQFDIEFLKKVMESRFDSPQAPSLQGEKVIDHIDIMTVHYMFAKPERRRRMQAYADAYLKTGRIKGIWVTEEHGRKGKGPVTIIDRGTRFLTWAAKNGFDATQVRLIWYGDGATGPGGSGRQVERLLGEYLANQDLSITEESHKGVRYTTILGSRSGEPAAIVVVVFPTRPMATHLRSLKIDMESKGLEPWEVRIVCYSYKMPPREVHFMNTGGGRILDIKLNHELSTPLVIFGRR